MNTYLFDLGKINCDKPFILYSKTLTFPETKEENGTCFLIN